MTKSLFDVKRIVKRKPDMKIFSVLFCFALFSFEIFMTLWLVCLFVVVGFFCLFVCLFVVQQVYLSA